MKPKGRMILLPLVRYWWGFRTTWPGKLLAACIVIAAGPAVLSLEVPAYQLFVALSFFALFAWCAAFVARPRLDCAWRLPEKAVTGRPIEIACELRNRSRFWARDIGVGAFDVPAALAVAPDPLRLDTLAPGASSRAAFTMTPLRRGIYAWPTLRAYSCFPFGLFRTGARGQRGVAQVSPAPLLVYPAFTRLSGIDVPINARYQPGGIALSSSVGESPEYIGNREYRPGDSTRHLDHRSWARLAAPAVREYQEEYYCRVALVLDTFVPGTSKPGPRGFPDLEAAVSLSAAVADALARGEYIIDLFAAGPELHVFRAGRHTAHFENVLEILACVGACRKNPFGRITPALVDELAGISSVICVFLDWDAERMRLVRAAAEAGSSVKVAIVREGHTMLPLGAGELAGAITQYAPEVVRSGGVDHL